MRVLKWLHFSKASLAHVPTKTPIRGEHESIMAAPCIEQATDIKVRSKKVGRKDE